MLIENLMDFGLSEKDARVYLALLELEVATANETAKQAGVNRSSTYVVLESLKKRGFVHMSADKNIKHYVATSPELLLQLAKKRVEKQDGVITMLENIMPDLKALNKGTKHKPKVFVYEGRNNVEALYYKELSALKPGSNFKSYEDMAEIDKYMPGFIEKDSIERKKKHVLLYSINPNTVANQEIMKKYKYLGSEEINQLIPVENFNFSKTPISLAIYEDGVSFYGLQESFAIVIKQKEIADTIRNIFNLAWEESKRLNQYKVPGRDKILTK
ncbi:TPA: hypothetical protein DCQ44_03525 [Candidatus Taylorbacteria bacterium]|nr:hypothetical protein [Candidatus Taylorbacteria bacterium]